MLDLIDMFGSFLLCITLGFASVTLVPKEGVVLKKEGKQEYAAEAGDSMPAVEPEVILRRPKKERVVQSNTKKKSKSKKTKKTELNEEIEDLEQIYKDEKEFLESKEELKSPKPRKAASDDKNVKSRDSSRSEPKEFVSSEDKSSLEMLKTVEKKYKKASFVKIRLTKEVTQELLERTKNYKGELSLATGGQLKLEINEPQKSMLLVNTKNVWMVDYPIDEAQDKVQILRSDKPEKLKSQGLIALLIGRKSLADLFEIQVENTKGKSGSNGIVYKLAPKKKNLDIKTVELHVDSDKRLFTQIIYWDELGNRTSYTFANHTFSEKSPKSFFDFKQPDNASITDL